MEQREKIAGISRCPKARVFGGGEKSPRSGRERRPGRRFTVNRLGHQRPRKIASQASPLKSGSPQWRKIVARAASRSRTAAAQSSPSGEMAGSTITSSRPRRGNHEPARNIERVPRIVTGTTGVPACAAATNAPIRNSSSPGIRVKVPSGKNPSDCPASTAALILRDSSTLRCTSKRSTNSVPIRCSGLPIQRLSSNSRLAT